MTMTTLATAVSAYKLVPAGQHYSTRRSGGALGIVLHVTAGLQDLGMSGTDESMEGTIKWAVNSRPKVSWHAGTDSDGVELCLPDWYTGWHATGYNSRTIGIEIANVDARWDNKPAAWVTATLRHTARIAAAYCEKYGFPLVLANKSTVDSAIANNRKFGFTYHSFTSPTSRRDPGATFPWSKFIAMVKEEMQVDAPLTPAPPTTKPTLLTVDGKFGPKTIITFKKNFMRGQYNSGVALNDKWDKSAAGYLEHILNREAEKQEWDKQPTDGTTMPNASSTHTVRLNWLFQVPKGRMWSVYTTTAIQRSLNANMSK